MPTKNLNQVIYWIFLLVFNQSTKFLDYGIVTFTSIFKNLCSAKIQVRYRYCYLFCLKGDLDFTFISTHEMSAKLNPCKNLIKIFQALFHIILGVSQTLSTLIIIKMARPISTHLIPQAQFLLQIKQILQYFSNGRQ